MCELKKAIIDQHKHLQDLQQTLESELHLISSRDAESLIKLLESKEALLNTIQHQDELIERLYLQADTNTQQSTDTIKLFDEAKELVAQCQFRTQINQTAVEQGQLRLEHLRNLLLESRAKESMTYDRSGKTKGGRSGGGISA